MIREEVCRPTTKNDEKLNLYLHIIAHEIRSPLVSIQGYAHLLQEQLAGNVPRECSDYLRRIDANLKRADALLSDISRLARVAIDEDNFRKVGAHELVNQAVETHQIHIAKSGLELTVEEDLPDLYCDAAAMVTVFSNLIGNAIKYSRQKKGGKIEIGYLRDEIFHKFYIKDDGVGFQAKDSSKVFLLFRRLRNKKDVSGTGLGLCIVKQIIEGHGGEIWVESRKNRGATFFFTLPKNSPHITEIST